MKKTPEECLTPKTKKRRQVLRDMGLGTPEQTNKAGSPDENASVMPLSSQEIEAIDSSSNATHEVSDVEKPEHNITRSWFDYGHCALRAIIANRDGAEVEVLAVMHKGDFGFAVASFPAHDLHDIKTEIPNVNLYDEQKRLPIEAAKKKKKKPKEKSQKKKSQKKSL